MRWPILAQVLVPVAALMLGAVGLGTWMAYAAAERAIRQQVEAQVRNMAGVLGDVPFPLTSSVLQQVKGLSGTEVVVIAPDGRCLSTLPSVSETLLKAVPLEKDGKAFRLSDPVLIGDETFLLGGVQLHTSRGDEAGLLILLYPYSRWQQALWEAVRPVLAIGALGGVLAVVLAILIAARLSSRVRDLQRRTRLIAAGDFGPMPLPLWNDELRDLAVSVNEMAEQLTQLRDTVQKTERLRLLGQLGGGLAHQLRNGITGARLAVQVHLREHPELDNEPLEVALRQLSLVETHLHRFLDLGRTDAETQRLLRLPELIQETLQLLQPQARHHQVKLTWNRLDSSTEDSQHGNETAGGQHEPPGLWGHPGSLSHLLLNVVQNGIEAAGRGGSVEIVTRYENGQHIVEVFDTGPGPDPRIAERLFEPFVTGKPDGIGLGLAVAWQVAQSHGGNLSWFRADNRTCFRLVLPSAENSVSHTDS